MPGATTTTTTAAGTNLHVEQVSVAMEPRTYLCTSCRVSFQDGKMQRIHMKEPWHVYNIKRRIAALPPITFETFESQISKDENDHSRSRKSKHGSNLADVSDSDDIASNHEDSESVSPCRCLFCNQSFDSHDDGLALNVEHMQTAHGMSIPDIDTVSDLQSFVGYLATEVRSWHECLYCGATKPSTRSIQSHMRDKDHCRLNLDREPELLEFWEGGGPRCSEGDCSSNEAPAIDSSVRLSATEIRLASGNVMTSRYAASLSSKQSRGRKASPPTVLALPDGSAEESEHAAGSDSEPGPDGRSNRELVRRDEMGLTGVSTQQRRALVLAEKKAQRSEAIARRAREWAYANGANHQKYDQVDTKAKWGKQNHKLQPR